MSAPRGVDYYLALIFQLWPDFRDDGLSGGFPDWVYASYNLRLAGRVHDWHYCTRCHPAGSMTQAARRFADLALRQHARELLPWWLRVAPWVLYLGVHWFGDEAAWDGCGPEQGDLCRHNIEQPVWMRALA
jgi:hypothetical protein